MLEDGHVVSTDEDNCENGIPLNEADLSGSLETLKFSLLPSHTNYLKSDTPIFCLPNELVIDIFKLLPALDLLHNVPRVCQLWYNLSLNPVLRTRLVVGRQIPSNYFLKALSTRPTLRQLCCPAFKHAGVLLPDAIKLCPLLECLDIGFCALDEQAIISLACNLPSTLLHLNIEGVITVEINFITVLVSKCPKLEALNLSHCVSVCDICVKTLTQGLENLRRLNLDGELWLSDEGLSYISDSLSARSGKLNALWLDGFEFSNSGLSYFFQSFAQRERNFTSSTNNTATGLHSLWISFCDHMEDDSLRQIAYLPNLVSLTLRKAHQVTAQGFSVLFNTPYHINNNNINSETSIDQPMKLPSLMWLEHLDLSEAAGVTNLVITDICKCCGGRLRSLLLNWCWQLTDTGLEQIINVCFALRQLSLIGNSQIHGGSLVQIPDKQTHLVILNLTQCNHVHDEILEEIARKMTNLYIFDFFGERVGSQNLNDVCHFDLYKALGKVPICSD